MMVDAVGRGTHESGSPISVALSRPIYSQDVNNSYSVQQKEGKFMGSKNLISSVMGGNYEPKFR